MKLFWTKDREWLDKWDNYLINSERGNHLLLSDWLNSYSSYGFDFDVLLLLDSNNKIQGGLGIVFAKALFFKFAIVPIGPIVEKEFESFFNDFISEVLKKAKQEKACYCQISAPIVLGSKKNKFISNILKESIYNTGIVGAKFKYVYPSSGLSWVDLTTYTNEEDLLLSFKSKVRRDIRASLRKDLKVVYADNIEMIKIGYSILKNNSIENNYSIRDFSFFENYIFSLIKKGYAKLILAEHDNLIKGCILVIKSGNYFKYVMGGTVKQKPDLLIGYFLQWQIIKESLNLGLIGYDISTGGSRGVLKFKKDFNVEEIKFEPTRHWVLKPITFKLYEVLNIFLKKNKKVFSLILKKIKQKK